jgi:hypothetical protein
MTENTISEPRRLAFSDLPPDEQESLAAALSESITFGMGDSCEVAQPSGKIVTFTRAEIDRVNQMAPYYCLF